MLLSGGIDSATSLYVVRAKRNVRALTFEYNRIARKELESAKAIASHAKVMEHRIVRLPDLKEAGDIPGFVSPGLPPTYIPLRNSIFYSFAASYAEETGAGLVVGGHNRDDLDVLPDVGRGFFRALEAALWKGSPTLRRAKVRIARPLGRMRKVEVITLAASLGVPFELTWSCHRDGKRHCWRCQGCLSRRKSFRAAMVEDPLDESNMAKIT